MAIHYARQRHAGFASDEGIRIQSNATAFNLHYPEIRMKYAILVARILLGLIFLLFGANHIVPFLPMPPMSGDAGTFATILAVHKYLALVGLLEVIAGLLLLVGRFVPMALTILGPIVVNILLFSALLERGGFAIPLVVTVLELFLLFTYRLSFAGIFSAGPEVMGSPKL
jgi:putative oxidoreductase